MTITALIHTRNEAANLPACLASVKWADEVIVADMASTDATREIATAAGARLIDMPLAPVVEPVRNLAIGQCTGDWVLIVDADERVPASLAPRLRQLAQENRAAAYALPRKNFFQGVWLEHGFWPDHHVRFFRRGTVAWPPEVHSFPLVTGNLVELPADPNLALEHPGYGNDLQRYIEKFCHYSPMEAKKLLADPRPPLWPYLVRRPVSEFYGRYLTDQGWRHGLHGLVWAMLQAVYQTLVVAHYWSLLRAEAAVEPRGLRRKVRWEIVRNTLKWLRP
jgi:glycosyltransferase involved in cell wall biosynthesis